MTTVAAPGAAATGPEGARLARDTATVSLMTLVSRVTGFARIFVVTGVLGTTLLGNTYQTTNSVPNLVFELFAAGMLQAVLVPELVGVLAARGRADGERVAGLVLGALLVVLGGLALVGALAAPLISRALFAGSPATGATYDDQVWLGTLFLWIFLPQIVFYAIGMVGTAVLNAQDRFAVPAFAPVLNNVVVIGAYLAFGAIAGGDDLDLSLAELAVLAGGTTLGVVAFTALPAVAVVRGGFSIRPRFRLGDPELRRLGRKGLWAGAFLALTQVLLLCALVLGNSVTGGAVIYQLGYTFFLLPHALVSIPVFTAIYPSLARLAQRGDRHAFVSLVRRGTGGIWVLVLPAAAAMVTLGGPAARLTLFGDSAASADDVAATIAAFALGLAPFGLFLLLTRASYARGDERLPTVVHGGATVAGVAGMVVAALSLDGGGRIAGMAGAHSLAYAVGAVVLGRSLAVRVGGGRLFDLRRAAGALASALVAGAVMAAVVAAVDGGGRSGAALELAAGGIAGLVTYLAGLRVTGVGDPRHLLGPEADPAAGPPPGAGIVATDAPDGTPAVGAPADGPGDDRAAGPGRPGGRDG